MTPSSERASSPERTLFARSLWVEAFPVGNEAVKLDYKRPVLMDESDYDRVAAMTGERLQIVAAIKASPALPLLLLDTRNAETIFSPFLLVQYGDTSGEHYKGLWPDQELIIGRDHHKDRFSYKPLVSRDHFMLHFDSKTEELTLRDLNSTNGTAVTGNVFVSPNSMQRTALRADYTRSLLHVMRDNSGYLDEDERAPYGYFRGHPIIGRNSLSVRDGVYGTSHSEYILVDTMGDEVQAAVRNFREDLGAIAPAPTLLPRQVLRMVEDRAAALLAYDLQRTEDICAPYTDKKNLIHLSDFIREGVGVCRQQALLAALFIEEVVDMGYLSGSAAVERNYDQGIGGHAWAVYKDSSNADVIIDPASHFVGTRQEARRQNRWPYLVGNGDE